MPSSSRAAAPATRRPGTSSSSGSPATSTRSAFRRFRLAVPRRRGRLPGGLRPGLPASRPAAVGRGDPAVDRAAHAAALHRPACAARAGRARRSSTSSSSAALDETLRQLDEALTVRAGLDAVGEPCREILDRFFCRDESYKTIGEALDLPAGTIASRISRCLGKLQIASSREDPERLGASSSVDDRLRRRADRGAAAASPAGPRGVGPGGRRSLPQARAEIAALVARAEADAAFRARVVADLEAALEAEGIDRRLPPWSPPCASSLDAD